MGKKTCFVAIGFGQKTDYQTGRVLDLDKTYEYLIKPVFDELDIDCFRAKEIKHSGIIDVPMYEWLLKADIVVADISTLNPNAIYELGIRHALRPFTTIVISEKGLQDKTPFDVNRVSISYYEHLGPDIGFGEVKRFTGELKKKVEAILAKTEDDSPIYTFLKGLVPPVFKSAETALKDAVAEASEPALNIGEMKAKEESFSDLVKRTEKAKNEKKFLLAAEIFQSCLEFEPNNTFLKQRLALVTYKSKQPDEKQALLDAEKILAPLNPEKTTNPETLGLSGAINKRLHEITGDGKYLDKSIWFYERGFYIQQDYYNGINLAYMLALKASIITDRFEAIGFYLQAKQVWEKIVSICDDLIAQKTFDDRSDREWIYQSLAQAYLGLGREDEVEKVIPEIQKYSKGDFDLDTFKEQNEKLIKNLEKFKEAHNYPEK